MNRTEIWAAVPEYEGLYEVSNYGKVRRVGGAALQGNINSYGYRVVRLTRNGRPKDKKVHRLVALAFLPTIAGKNDVNHKDGDKLNNCVENLEWVTRGENNKHAATILQVSTDARPVWQLSLDGTPLAIFFNTTIAASVVGGSQMMIGACCKGTAKTAYDYKWQYADSEVAQRLLAECKADAVRAKISRLRAEISALETLI